MWTRFNGVRRRTSESLESFHYFPRPPFNRSPAVGPTAGGNELAP
jgi:hypothetical protein